MNANVVIVDDEPRMAEAIAVALRRDGHRCVTCASGEEALRVVAEESIDVVVTDRRMPGLDGIELLGRLHRERPELPVVLVTAYADVDSAVAALRDGAFDYVAKPFDNDELRAIVRRAVEVTTLRRENRWLRQEVDERYAPEAVVAESAEMRRVIELVRRVAPTDSAVLIRGESGTGKELVARLVHYWSDRVGRPFVAVNCRAFASGVLESELFGHEKGAFTGATGARAGCFERADGGTLFLDEIAEVETEFQAKLLRVIQEREVLRVGGSSPRRIDVRLVAATNRDLDLEIAEGRFREDLYFRLHVIPVRLAPLRERREDVLPLARRLLGRLSDGRRALRLDGDAERALLAHDWPGNVRELANAIERGSVLARGDAITADDLLLESRPSTPALPDPASGESLQAFVDRATRERIRLALEEHGGRRAEAARALGVDRTTLYRLAKRLGLD